MMLLCTYWSGLPEAATKPPRKPAAVPPPAIYSVKLELANDQLVVSGSDLDPTTVLVTLGGTSVAIGGASTHTVLLIPFSLTLAGIVDAPGNYTLSISTDGGMTELGVYMPYALPAGTGADCPCQAIWETYGTTSPPGGFAGLTPACAYESAGGDQISVQFFDEPNFNLWILTSEYNTVAQECALVIDEPTQPLSSAAQHQACANYLRTTYITPNPGLPSCL